MRILRRHVGKHGNHPFPAQGKDRHDLIVIPRIHIKLLPAGMAQTKDRGQIPVCLLDRRDARVL